MKKVLLMILVGTLMLSLLLSCAEQQTMGKTETAIAKQLQTVKISNLTAESVAENEFTSAHYLDSPLSRAYSEYAAEYVESDVASSEFVEFWNSCSDIRYYPIFGTYLEYTNLFLVAFYEDDAPMRSFTLEVQESENDCRVIAFTHENYTRETYNDDGELLAIAPFHDEYIIGILEQITELGNQATIQGVVFSTTSFAVPYVVASEPNGNELKYWNDSQWTDFGLVDGFSDFEEGRTAFQTYFTERESLLTSIPIYEWDEDVERAVDFKQFAFKNYTGVLREYETYAAIPLLDENCEEDNCVLFLVYHHNDLIGEIVVRCDGEVGEEVWRREADKDSETGAYIPLENSYVDVIKQAKSEGKIDVRGVSFRDGQLLPVGLDAEGQVKIYDIQTVTSQSIDEYLK